MYVFNSLHLYIFTHIYVFIYLHLYLYIFMCVFTYLFISLVTTRRPQHLRQHWARVRGRGPGAGAGDGVRGRGPGPRTGSGDGTTDRKNNHSPAAAVPAAGDLRRGGGERARQGGGARTAHWAGCKAVRVLITIYGPECDAFCRKINGLGRLVRDSTVRR